MNKLKNKGAETKERLIKHIETLSDENEKELQFLYDFVKAFDEKWMLKHQE